jgi:hypothetical protein
VIPALDEIGIIKPSAIAFGTSSKTIVCEVDGAAVVGHDRKRFKTRFPTSMRLSKEARAYALATGFEPAKVDRMFESFRSYNVAKLSYSLDWDAAWFNWADREVDIHNEAHNKARSREYSGPPMGFWRRLRQRPANQLSRQRLEDSGSRNLGQVGRGLRAASFPGLADTRHALMWEA